MNGKDPVELDPELLADPMGDEEGGKERPQADSTALVPAVDRSIAPYDPFLRYRAEISKYPPLDRDEERELARQYRDTGDREALFRLITANLMLVVHIAFSFRRAARNLLDLIQEGNIGLLRAIDRFDPELGVRLPTYAGWWIRAYMVKFLLDNVRLVRVGTTNARRKLLRNLRREKEKLEEQGFEVGPKLLAEHFQVSEEDVRDVQAALDSRDVSIDAPVTDGEERRHADMLPDERAADIEEEVGRRELQQRVQAALQRFRETLQERDLALLDERILSDAPLTLQALGERFGTTREAVRQAEVRLMKRIEIYLKEELGDLGHISFGPGS
jgi:RNA polymerase sigma-32 factor